MYPRRGIDTYEDDTYEGEWLEDLLDRRSYWRDAVTPRLYGRSFLRTIGPWRVPAAPVWAAAFLGVRGGTPGPFVGEHIPHWTQG